LVDFVNKVVNDITDEVVDDIVDDSSDHQCFPSSSGARPVLPMGVAPEAIVKKNSSIGSNILSSHLSSFFILTIILSGARPALPMVVAPEAIRGCLFPFIDSNISFAQLFLYET
jgi:hypothetical protein